MRVRRVPGSCTGIGPGLRVRFPVALPAVAIAMTVTLKFFARGGRESGGLPMEKNGAVWKKCEKNT